MPSFGRLPQHDERNALYPIRSLMAAVTPKARSYTWPLNLPILNQSKWSGCVGWTGGEELASTPVPVKGVDDLFCLNLYWDIQDDDEWDGSERPGVTPQMQGTSMLALARRMKALGHWPEYRWGHTLDEIKFGVGNRGPMPIGVDWTTGCMKTDVDGFVHPERGGVVGGHAVLLRGHSARRKAFLGRNHWKRSWGADGEFWVSYAGVEEWLARQGDFILPMRQKIPESLLQGLADVAAGRVQPWDPDRYR